MSLDISKQSVLITGAGRGLGAAIAKAFAREGASVAINYRQSKTQAENLADELGPRCAAFRADVRKSEQVEEMFVKITGKFGAPTTVVHNALDDYLFNGDQRNTLDSLSCEHILHQVETAAYGALNVIKAAKAPMIEAAFGRIITIGSNLVQNPVVPYHDYTFAKSGLLALTRTCAAELGPEGITVNMVSGGLLRTTDASAATPESVFNLIAANTPLRSVTTPEELADVVLFFASPWARAITGQNLIVDGGLVYG